MEISTEKVLLPTLCGKPVYNLSVYIKYTAYLDRLYRCEHFCLYQFHRESIVFISVYTGLYVICK